MSNMALTGVLSVTVALGLGIGWTLGAPKPPPAPLVNSHFAPAGTEAPPAPPPTGEDTAPGWQDRNKLRSDMTAAIDLVKSAPCDADKRDAFLAAFTAFASVKLGDDRAAGSEDGAPFWRTSEDATIRQQLKELKDRGFIDDDELGRAMINKQLGASNAAELVRIQGQRDVEKGIAPPPPYEPTSQPPPYCRRSPTPARLYGR